LRTRPSPVHSVNESSYVRFQRITFRIFLLTLYITTPTLSSDYLADPAVIEACFFFPFRCIAQPHQGPLHPLPQFCFLLYSFSAPHTTTTRTESPSPDFSQFLHFFLSFDTARRGSQLVLSVPFCRPDPLVGINFLLSPSHFSLTKERPLFFPPVSFFVTAPWTGIEVTSTNQ